MADPTLVELYASRETDAGQSPTARFMFMVYRTFDEPTVRNLVLSHPDVPVTYFGLYQQRLNCKPLGGGVWVCTLDFAMGSRVTDHNPTTQQPQGGDTQGGDPVPPEMRVSSKATSRHVNLSLLTAQTAKAQGDDRKINRHNNAIGVSKGSVAGCDIPVGDGFTWTETWRFLAAGVSWNYIERISRAVGRVNYGVFRALPVGSVMFLGFESEPAGLPWRRIVYEFSYKRNRDGITFVPGAGPLILTDENNNIISLDKYGHEYLWVEYEEKESPNADGMVTVPRSFYLEIVGPDEGQVGDTDFIGFNRNEINRRDFTNILRIGS